MSLFRDVKTVFSLSGLLCPVFFIVPFGVDSEFEKQSCQQKEILKTIPKKQKKTDKWKPQDLANKKAT